MTILGLFYSSTDQAGSPTNSTNNDIEMAPLGEQSTETKKQDQVLMSIICKKRESSDILSVKEIKALKTSYEFYHETNLTWYYQYIRDFADFKSLELIMDQSWSFEKDLHRGKVEPVSNELYSAGDAEKDKTIASADDQDVIHEAFQFDDSEHHISSLHAATCLNENVNNDVLKVWIFQHLREERGFGYNLEKFQMKIVKPFMPFWKKIQSFNSFFKLMMITKSLLFGLGFSIMSFLDAIKDVILVLIIWFFSNKILVCLLNTLEH